MRPGSFGAASEVFAIVLLEYPAKTIHRIHRTKSYQQVAFWAQRRSIALRQNADMLLDRNSKDGAETPLDAGDTVAGWRLVRPLTQDRREFVGVAEFPTTVGGSGSDHWYGFAEASRPRLQHRRIVVATGQTACSKLAEECSIRDEVCSEFVELAEETLVDGDHRIAIFPIRQVRPWTEVIAREITFTAGAVVTALVPIAEALQLAHKHGIAHGAVSLHACHIDEHGRPGLDDWGSAVRLSALTTVKIDLARGNDLRNLGKVADALLSTCSQTASDQLQTLVDALCDGVTPRDAAGRLIDALFQWSEPEPLPVDALPGTTPDSFHREPREGVSIDPGSPGAFDSDADEPLISPAPAKSRRRILLQCRDVTISAVARFVPWVGSIRPAIWAGVGVVGLIALLGGALLAGTSSNLGGSPPPSAPNTPRAVAETANGPTVGFETVAEPTPPSQATPTTAIATAPGLIAARNECWAASDVQCLTDLYAADAPGLAADLAAMDGEKHEDMYLSEQQEWLLAADLGDIELITGSEAGSLSLERTSEGWLLREIWFPKLPG